MTGLEDASGMEGEQDQRDPDWWQEHLAPSAQRKEEMARAIQDYVRAIRFILN
jgi:hypothetical protein